MNWHKMVTKDATTCDQLITLLACHDALESPNNFDSKRKQNKFHKNMRNNHRTYQGNNYKGFKPQDFAVPSTVPNKNPAQKNP